MKRINKAIERLAQLKVEHEYMDEIEAALYKRGIIPIQTGRKIKGKEMFTSKLGYGTFQSAYEVLYKGKRAVAKVQKRKSSDARKSLELSKMRDRMPERYKKYIMEVYDYFELEIYEVTEFENAEVAECIIVEYLHPLRSGIGGIFGKDERQGSDKAREDATRVIIGNKVLLRDIIDKAILKEYRNLGNEKIRGIRNDIIRKVEGGEEKFVKQFSNYDIELNDIITDILKKNKVIMDHIKQYTYTDITANEKVELAGRGIAQNIRYIMYRYIIEKVPTFDSDDEEGRTDLAILGGDEKVREFVKFLRYLKQEGWIWGDLHWGNVMERGNGELVISDPGLFENEKFEDRDGDDNSVSNNNYSSDAVEVPEYSDD